MALAAVEDAFWEVLVQDAALLQQPATAQSLAAVFLAALAG